MLRTNNLGFTTIELLIGLVLVAIIAMTLSNFVTTSFRTNTLVTEDTDTLITANKAFDNIYNEAKYGFDFTSDGNTLTFSTPDYDASGKQVTINIWLDGNDIKLDRNGVTRILSSNIEDLAFTVKNNNSFNVDVAITLAGRTYHNTIRALNYVPPQ